MIEPGDLHRYFKVRELATGREVWILAGDTRYTVTGGGLGDYRPEPGGEYFLAASAVRTNPWGRPMRLEEVEPLPGGVGLYHPDHLRTFALELAMTYEGSWRQAADLARAWPRRAARRTLTQPGARSGEIPGTTGTGGRGHAKEPGSAGKPLAECHRPEVS